MGDLPHELILDALTGRGATGTALVPTGVKADFYQTARQQTGAMGFKHGETLLTRDKYLTDDSMMQRSPDYYMRFVHPALYKELLALEDKLKQYYEDLDDYVSGRVKDPQPEPQPEPAAA